MPRAPRKCNKAGCEERQVGTYCLAHAPMNWGKGSGRTGSREHKDWRANVLKRDGGICQTRGPGCQIRATEADHIVPIAEGGATSLENGAAICAACHKRKTSAEAARGRARNANTFRD